MTRTPHYFIINHHMKKHRYLYTLLPTFLSTQCYTGLISLSTTSYYIQKFLINLSIDIITLWLLIFLITRKKISLIQISLFAFIICIIHDFNNSLNYALIRGTLDSTNKYFSDFSSLLITLLFTFFFLKRKSVSLTKIIIIAILFGLINFPWETYVPRQIKSDLNTAVFSNQERRYNGKITEKQPVDDESNWTTNVEFNYPATYKITTGLPYEIALSRYTSRDIVITKAGVYAGYKKYPKNTSVQDWFVSIIIDTYGKQYPHQTLIFEDINVKNNKYLKIFNLPHPSSDLRERFSEDIYISLDNPEIWIMVLKMGPPLATKVTTEEIDLILGSLTTK